MRCYFNLVIAFVATAILASSCNKEPINEPVEDNTVNFTATLFTGIHFIQGGPNRYMVTLSDEGYVHTYMFTLYGQLGEIDDNGNVTIPSGTYTLKEGHEDFTIDALARYIDMSEGEGKTKRVELTELTVVVSDNQMVLTTVVEGVKHIATYNGPISMPAKLPNPDIDFEASYAYAYYTDIASDEGRARFKLFLSDLGRDEDGNAKPNATYYEFVLDINRLEPNAEIAIPAGRYEIGDTDSANGYIVETKYYKFGESLSEPAKFDTNKTGHLIVNEDGSMEASIKMYFDGSTHTVTFSGEVEILENTIPSEAPYSKLTSDKECDLSNHSIDVWVGGIYETGYQSYTVSITSNKPFGDNISFEVLRGTEKGADLTGRYTLSSSRDEFSVIPGYVNGFTLMGSWYYYKANSMNIPVFAPIVDGWVDIQVADKKRYTVTFNVYDDLNNNITGTLTAEILASASSVSGVSYPSMTL